MKINSQSYDCFTPSVSWKLLVAVFCAVAWLAVPGALAQQQQQQLATNANGKMTDTNDGGSGSVRHNYHLRFPFAKAAFTADKLQKITAADGAGAGAGAGTQNQSGNEGTGEITNLQKSVLNQIPHPVVAYTPVYSYIPYEVPSVLMAMDKPLTDRDNEIFQNTLTTFGYPISDTQFQLIDRENKQRFLELMYDPERFMWLMTNIYQMTGAAAANSLGGSSEAAYQTAAQNILDGSGGGAGGGGFGAGGAGGAQVGALINVANENAGVPTASDNPNKTVPQAVWMVQQMYSQVFVPMAILFLLPGAILSQVQQNIVNAFGPSVKVDDPPNPFTGILRSIIAIFLIPATQLIVSYSIDTGNSMAYSVKDWVNLPLIFDWAHNLSYNTPPNNAANKIAPSQAANGGNGNQSLLTGGGGPAAAAGGGGLLSGLGSALSSIANVAGLNFGGSTNGLDNIGSLGFGSGGQGLGDQMKESTTVPEDQLWLSQVMEVTFDMAMYLFSTAVIILGAYQLVLMCYLYLLGPLSAAFFAWPAMTQQSKVFRTTWSNWLGAVITVALWRFYWMVILAIMTQRILYLMDNGGGSMDLQWEVAVFTCLLGLMFYVPFNPFNFDPGQAFMAASQAGSSLMSGSAGGSNGQQGGLTGALGQAAIAGGANPAQVQSAQGNVAGVANQVAHAGTGAQENLYKSEGIGGNGVYLGTNQGAGGGGAGGGGAQQQSLSSNHASSPQAGSPNVSPPPQSGSGAAQTAAASIGGAAAAQAPPTSGGTTGGGGPAQAASPQALQTASSNTGAQAATMSSPTPPLSPSSGASPASPQANVNPNASHEQVNAATSSSSGGTSQPAGGGGAPPTSGSGSGSGSGSSGADVVASGATVAALSNNNTQPPPISDGPKNSNSQSPPTTEPPATA